MRVFIIGAGFSAATAKYPVTNDLLPELDLFANTHARPDLAAEWRRMKQWLDRGPTFVVAEAVRRVNIEYLLTALDLYCELFKEMQNAALRGDPVAQNTWKRKGDMLGRIEKYRNAARRILVHYFEWLHWSHSSANGQEARANVERFCNVRLAPGDVIVTFNYDSLLERTLFEKKLWHPGDGYGFRIPLQSMIGDESRRRKSSIIVLKATWLSRMAQFATEYKNRPHQSIPKSSRTEPTFQESRSIF